MIKKSTHILLILLSVLTVLPATAYDFESAGIYYDIIDMDAHTVAVADEKYSGAITIPAFVTYNGTDYAVTGIKNNTFLRCYDLTSITVDSENMALASVDGALYNKNMTKLITCPKGKTSVRIPDTVTEIEKYAFSNCDNLTSITVDNGNKAYASFDGALYNKDITKLITCPEGKTSIVIPNTMTTIEDHAFDWCDKLMSITVDNGNMVFASADGVLYNKDFTKLIKCPEGKTSINIPNSVTTIGIGAFDSCRNLTSVEIPSSVTTIGLNAFSYCKSLTSINIPNSVTTIEYSTFSNCDNLTSVKIPSSVTTIGDLAFSNSGLTSVEIPASVTTIGTNAFYGCNSLTSIEIPASVTAIGVSVFTNCRSLTSITVDSENKMYASVDGVLYNKDITKLIECPAGKTSVRIPDTVTTIIENAFASCNNLTSVEIPASVTTIGPNAFFGCNNLTSITVDSKNKVYASVDGVLYNKDKTDLIADPTYKILSEPEHSSITLGNIMLLNIKD